MDRNLHNHVSKAQYCVRQTVELSSDQILVGSEGFSILASLLKRYGKAKALTDGRRVHNHIMQCDYGRSTFLENFLVHMYGECGMVEDAQVVFDKIVNPDLYSWNMLIKVYGQNGSFLRARNVFDSMPFRDVVSWNAMIAVSVQNGHGKEALDLFDQMQSEGIEPNNVTFVSVVDGCTSIAALEKGKVIHAMIIDSGYEGDVIVGTALINMYGKCGSLGNARRAFDRLPYRDVVAWTAMIGSFTLNWCGKEALLFFRQMQSEGVQPNNITFLCAVEACAGLASFKEGQEMHASIMVSHYRHDMKVGNALIDMYGKCGNLDCAKSVFSEMPHRTIVSWNTMIAILSLHGYSMAALALFCQMQYENVKPDNITFTAVLNACSHTGLVDDGRNFFFSMNRNYGIMYEIDHYVCMIDLLGRAGCLDEAEDIIANMPFENATVPWLSLLSACRIHGDVERGVRVANHCIKLNPKNDAPYVILSNLCSGGMPCKP